MKLFLTGATGFIGSHFMTAALEAGHQVRALRHRPQSSSILELPREPEWCTGNLSSIEPALLRDVDVVVHLASAGVSPKKAAWGELIETNVIGSLRLAQTAAASGVKRCVVAGTSHEYGNAANRYSAIPPDAPLEPINPYGASKAAGFHLLRTLCIQENIELFYGRIFSAYGDGQFEGNFWPSLRRAAMTGQDFQMTSGRQISDFIPVGMVVDHLLEACGREDLRPGVPMVLNIGSGVATSLLTFAETEWSRLGATGRLLPGSLPDRADQIDRYVPDLRGLNSPSSLLNGNP